MSERTSRKIPVTERQFLWVQDDDKGEVTLHVGPTMVSPTAADRVVVDDDEGGLVEDVSGKPQQMVELGDNQYAVLSNPLLEADAGPNGRFKNGRNESRPLRNGTRSMIPGPCSFYLRPGQRVEVRDAHELASNQYLVVKVYGDVDQAAPFYEVTARSAAIVHATAENVRGEGGKGTRVGDLPVPAASELRRGQLIVIRGLDTQFYIPPTGVDIVPDTSIDDSGAALSAAAARQVLGQLRSEGGAVSAEVDRLTAELDAQLSAPEEQAEGAPRRQGVDQSARVRHRAQKAAASPAAAPAPGFAMPPAQQVNLLEAAQSPAVRKAIEKAARQARLVRRAVVLGEKEFCVLIDADGKREIKVGPARVFPGPYDTFMTKGSRNRVYDAYELLPQRALWLRVISPIARPDLERKLPRGFKLEGAEYYPGDELLLTGVSTFFFPFNEVEVLSPETGEAIVGNEHHRVFIEAIGIDQKSGIYVRDLSTGEVRLVRGKQSYLVDPRKEVQITRTVPTDGWNLWIGANEPHKHTIAPITTPWAVSVAVPHNTAVLATSAAAQRVIEGPCVELLDYEETLVPLSLSTGTPKGDAQPLRTCFLRTVGNRISDVISVETSDFVRISIKISSSVTFVRGKSDHWFNHENYIQLICDHLRSIVRSRARALSLSQLWPQIPALVRDTILGARGEAGRPGRAFDEIGATVHEVEVLVATIEDPEIAKLMARVQAHFVTLQIGDRQATETLASERLRGDVEREQMVLLAEARERTAKLEELGRRFAHESAIAAARDGEAIAIERQRLADARAAEALRAQIDRDRAVRAEAVTALGEDSTARAAATRTAQEVDLAGKETLSEIEIALLQAQSAATVAERQAVQAGLVEAMTALGDKIMLAEVAENMNLVSLFKGKDVGTILGEVLGGTRVMKTVRALAAEHGGAARGGDPSDPAG